MFMFTNVSEKSIKGKCTQWKLYFSFQILVAAICYRNSRFLVDSWNDPQYWNAFQIFKLLEIFALENKFKPYSSLLCMLYSYRHVFVSNTFWLKLALYSWSSLMEARIDVLVYDLFSSKVCYYITSAPTKIVWVG